MFSLEKTIDEVFCKCVCFNRDETLMAVGCADNKIVIFDTATNEKRTDLDELGMVKSSPIKSLSFNDSGSGIVVLFECGYFATWSFIKSEIEPEISEDFKKMVYVGFHMHHKTFPNDPPQEAFTMVTESGTFEARGRKILYAFGNAKGGPGAVLSVKLGGEYLLVLREPGTLDVLDLFNRPTYNYSDDHLGIASPTKITSIGGNKDRDGEFAVVCDDGTIIVAQFTKIDRLTSKFEAKRIISADNLQWKMAGFCQDLVYGVPVMSEDDRHLIYFWKSETGDLVQILEGPKDDGISEVYWNAARRELITVGSSSGKVYIWKLC